MRLSAAYRNLAACHRAGVPWSEALEQAGRGEPWRSAARAVRAGAPPAQALAGALPALDLAGLRAGEAAGRLEESLERLARLHEEEDRRTRARRSALAYPVLVSLLGALLLPIPDLVAGRSAAALGWFALGLLPVAFVVATEVEGRRGRGILAGRAAVEESDARALRALSWLHDAGLPLSEAVPLARLAGQGGRAARDLGRAEAEVARGAPMERAWTEVPAEVASVLSTAERTGTLAPALERAAEALDDSANARRKRLASLLPPLVLLGVGGIVAWRVIGFYAGYFSRLP
jgi:type II secretory pathway component PulF